MILAGLALAGCRVDFEDTTELVAISVRGDHGCGLTATGLVSCWGRGESGELGTGDRPIAATASIVPLDRPADAVATGEGGSCAILDGSVRCWGANTDLQVGAAFADPVVSPQPIALDASIRGLELGQHGVLARTDTGDVIYWGATGCGQLGDANRGDPVAPTRIAGIAHAIDLALSDVFQCAAIEGGDILCWGGFGVGAPESDDCSSVAPTAPVALLHPRSPVVDLDGGCHDHACAVLADGSVWCVGNNGDGQLGDGTTNSWPLAGFVQVVGIDDAIDVAVGGFHACAARRNGTVSCWGENQDGQLGDGKTEDRSIAAPTLPMPVAIDQIEGSCVSTCARGGDRMWCWGNGEGLILGNGRIANTSIPTEGWRGPTR